MAKTILRDGEKKCPRCGQIKPFAQFHRNQKAPDGLQTYCKPCGTDIQRDWARRNQEKCKEKCRRWRAENPERSKASSLDYYYRNREKFRQYERKNAVRRQLGRRKRKFGIDPIEFLALVARQDHRCAICGKRPRCLCVDHCHKTGRIRGLLCGPCNKALGAFGDNLNGLMRAVEYLRLAELMGGG